MWGQMQALPALSHAPGTSWADSLTPVPPRPSEPLLTLGRPFMLGLALTGWGHCPPTRTVVAASQGPSPQGQAGMKKETSSGAQREAPSLPGSGVPAFSPGTVRGPGPLRQTLCVLREITLRAAAGGNAQYDLHLHSGCLLLPLEDRDETGTCQGLPVGPGLQRVSSLLLPTALTYSHHYIHLAGKETETQRG